MLTANAAAGFANWLAFGGRLIGGGFSTSQIGPAHDFGSQVLQRVGALTAPLGVVGDFLAEFVPTPQTRQELGTELAFAAFGPGGKAGKGLLKGASALREAAKRLGINPKRASEALHKAKQAVGHRQDVWIDPKNGDIIAPESGEVIGNLHHYN